MNHSTPRALSVVMLTIGCTATVVEPITDDDGDQASQDDGGSTVTAGGPTGGGPRLTCADLPRSVPAGACDATLHRIELTQAQAAGAIVGAWAGCNEYGTHFVHGAVFNADGSVTRLRRDEHGDLVCGEGIENEGDWYFEDHSGIGLPDEYSMVLTWDFGSWASVSPIFTNDGAVIRVEGTDETLIRLTP